MIFVVVFLKKLVWQRQWAIEALNNTVNAFHSEWHFLTEMINKTEVDK